MHQHDALSSYALTCAPLRGGGDLCTSERWEGGRSGEGGREEGGEGGGEGEG